MNTSSSALPTSTGVNHLLIVQLGPVQEFIAQARRTRDLWFGSHLLSELSRAAAKAAAAHGALIFPALDAGDPELEPCDTLVRATGEMPISIANKIVVELRPSSEAGRAAQEIRAAAYARWREIANQVRETHRGDLAEDIDAVWDEQIGSLVEYVAAWAPIDAEYARVRRGVEAALGGRRRLRDFAPIRSHRNGAPASSLDGGRVSVLAPPGTRRANRAERRLLLAGNESLDAVGVVKRRGGVPEQFLSVVNVAVLPWLRRAATNSRTAAAFEALREACSRLTVEDDKGVTRRLERLSRSDLPGAKLFPYNASVLFPSRLPAVFEELGAAKESQLEEAREWNKLLRPLVGADGEPPTYVACLVADGDRMGLAIDGLRSAAAHRKLAAGLGEFPGEARRIIEQDHDGIAVYAGGDDVLAFLPVCQAVACAEALQKAFASVVGKALAEARQQDQSAGTSLAEVDVTDAPTLSVGVGIGHILDNMGHLRDLGSRAEKTAKSVPGKNALTVLIDLRSGGDHLWSASWNDAPAARLADDVRLLTSGAGRPARLPMTKVHELARLLRSFSVAAGPNSPAAERAAPLAPEAGARVLRGEITRILARTHRGASHAPEAGTPSGDAAQQAAHGLTPEEVGLRVDDDPTFAELHRRLTDWVARLRIAHAIAVADPDRASSAVPLEPTATSHHTSPEEQTR
jgi:CRISPR-associated protein Cmr2